MLITEFSRCWYVSVCKFEPNQNQSETKLLNWSELIQICQTNSTKLNTKPSHHINWCFSEKLDLNLLQRQKSVHCQKPWRAQRGLYERLVVTVHASVAVLKSMCEHSLAKFSDNREQLHPAGITGRKTINSCVGQVCVYVKVFFARISLIC